MRVLVLCHPNLIPPLSWQKLPIRKLTQAKIDKIENAPWRTEAFVMVALKKVGHKVKFVGVEDSFTELRRTVKRWRPTVVFNLLEEFSGEALLEPMVVSVVNLLELPCTGCDFEGLLLAKNKIAAKSILAAQRVSVPGRSQFPMIVKLVSEESSRGISERSVVKNKKQLIRQLNLLEKKYNTQPFYEEYILGRELHVGILPDGTVTPVWETSFGRKPGLKVLTEKVKWNFSYRRKMKIELRKAEGLSDKVVGEIKGEALKAYRALKLSGCARVDVRLNSKNQIYVIEVNPNPDLAQYDEFALCAKSAGIEYDNLIEMLLQDALKRASMNG